MPSARRGQYRSVPESDAGTSDQDNEDNYSSSDGSQDEVEDDRTSSSSEREPRRKRWLSGTALGLVCLGTWLVASGAVLGVHEVTNPGTPLWMPAPTRSMIEAGPLDKPFGTDICKDSKGPYDWTSIPLSARPARKAAKHLLRLTKEKLAECEPPVGLNIGGQGGGQGGFSRKRHMRAAWKYSQDCQSITFRLKIFLPQKKKVWSGQAAFDLNSHHWRLLEDAFDPPICEISNDGAGTASRVPDASKDPEVVESAQFAVAELNYLRRKDNCAGSLTIGLGRVVKASQQLTQDVSYLMALSLNVTDTVTHSVRQELACVSVFERYSEQPPPKNLATGIMGKFNFSVCSDPSTWGECVVLAPAGRALGEVADGAADPTTRLVAWRVWRKHAAERQRSGRRLEEDGVKPPIALRFIPQGSIPADYDLRLDANVFDCVNKIPVYDQGSCGCCYGAAMAQMFSIRLCMVEAREVATQTRRLSGSTSTLRGGRRLEDPMCTDDLAWRSPDEHDCAWYGAGFERCAMADMGQLSYCRFSCHTCPNAAVNLDSHGTLQHYAYATQDVATCACNNPDPNSLDVATNCESKAGCNGGSMWAVWDAWLRLANRRLARRDCMPLSIKCLNSAGVTNPLSGDSCGAYASVPEWDRPCSCIQDSQIPDALPQCILAEDECSQMPPPDMVYQLMGLSHGLTNAETVQNMQRHIMEAGPIYVALTVSDTFMNFWSTGGGLNGDVYLGDNDADAGGHAVVLIGWGTTTAERPWGVGPGVLFWIFRNSWTESWGESGYGKIVAGRNTKGIEERAAAAMMGPHQDYTPPVCEWSTVSFPYLSFPGQLCRLEMELTVQCSEEATMEIYFSRAMAPELSSDDEAFDFDTPDEPADVYKAPLYRCPGLVDCKIKGFDLLYAGYGLQEATLYLKIRAWDQHSNAYSTSTTLPVSVIPGMDSVGGQKECGVPEFECDFCVDPVWPEPPAPTPAPATTPPPVAAPTQQGWPPAPAPPPMGPVTTAAPPPSEDGYRLHEEELPSALERLKGASQAKQGTRFCFPRGAHALLADGTTLQLSDLQRGHQLLGPGGSTEWLQDFHEEDASRLAAPIRYLRVTHSLQSPGRPLLVSPNHLVPRASLSLDYVPAAELKQGDELLVVKEGRARTGPSPSVVFSNSTILAIDEVVLEGFSAPLSSTGSLIVEGVLVSSYALLSEEQLSLWRRGPWLLRKYTQEICHILALPFRLHHSIFRTRRPPAAAGSGPTSGPAAPGGATYLRLISAGFDMISRLHAVLAALW